MTEGRGLHMDGIVLLREDRTTVEELSAKNVRRPLGADGRDRCPGPRRVTDRRRSLADPGVTHG
ncbi:hypothetical protein [Streptomyces sp. NPDC053755]|uniref:hypothetical protein n=1 Tax=Streptomyces sp. NPDC053755 TaxID=3155815 RepID=UPI003422F3BB